MTSLLESIRHDQPHPIHPFGNHIVTLLVGLALFLIGAWLMWDAYSGRGGETPVAVRAINII